MNRRHRIFQVLSDGGSSGMDEIFLEKRLEEGKVFAAESENPVERGVTRSSQANGCAATGVAGADELRNLVLAVSQPGGG